MDPKDILNTAGTAENSIKISSVAGGIDIDANQGKDIDIAGGQIKLTSKADANNTGLASAISFLTPAGTGGGAADTITITNTQGTTDGAITLTSTAGGITAKVADGKNLVLGNTAGDAYFKVAAHGTAGSEKVEILNTNGTAADSINISSHDGGLKMSAGGEIDISGGEGIKMSCGSAVSKLTLGNGTAVDSLMVFDGNALDFRVALRDSNDTFEIGVGSTVGTTTALSIDDQRLVTVNEDLTIASDGCVLTMGTTAPVTLTQSSNALTVSGTDKLQFNDSGTFINSSADGKLNLSSDGTTNDSIILTSSAGGITAKVADGKDLILGNTASDAYFKVAAHGTAGSEKIEVKNTNGTDAEAILLQSTAGGITAKVADEKNLVLGNAGSDAYFKVAASATAGSEKIEVKNTNGTAADSILLQSTAGGITAKVADGKNLVLGNADSDGFADIIGRRFGKTKWIHNNKKSVEGSIGYLVSSIIGTQILVNIYYHYNFNFWKIVFFSTLSCLVETIPGIDDNISIPVSIIFLNYLLTNF